MTTPPSAALFRGGATQFELTVPPAIHFFLLKKQCKLLHWKSGIKKQEAHEQLYLLHLFNLLLFVESKSIEKHELENGSYDIEKLTFKLRYL